MRYLFVWHLVVRLFFSLYSHFATLIQNVIIVFIKLSISYSMLLLSEMLVTTMKWGHFSHICNLQSEGLSILKLLGPRYFLKPGTLGIFGIAAVSRSVSQYPSLLNYESYFTLDSEDHEMWHYRSSLIRVQ